MIGIIKGLYTTGKHIFGKRYAFEYPNEKRILPDRYRGLLRLRGMIGEPGEVEACDYLPPCSTNCPSHVDARGQNILVAEGKHLEAYEVVRERNILPGALGRICHHPCESVCRRGHYDGSVAIRNLHTVIANKFLSEKPKIVNPNKGTKGKSVGIVGAGPSGLAAAYDLVHLGYDVTVYEKQHVAGGALATGVPAYRLPKDILKNEIDMLKDLGVVIKTGMEAGKDFQLDDLTGKYGHDSVLLSVGLQLSRGLPVPGMDLKGVSLALPFLEAVNFNEEIKPTKKLLVIGGGNVAIDVARCAVRVGYKEVHLACLEAAGQMPAHQWEVDEALEEGVIIHNCHGPQEILGDSDGKVRAVRFIKCLSVFDEDKRFNPKFDENDTNEVECDSLIVAIGQMSEIEFVKNANVELNERGQLMADRVTLATSREGVFASGEVVTGPGSAIASISSGHEAAISIDNYLSGRDLNHGRDKYVVKDWADAEPGMRLEAYNETIGGDEAFPSYHFPKGMVHERIGDFIPAMQVLRQNVEFVDPEIRKKNFDELELALTEEQALIEGWRCLRCESNKCVGCGICATVCPVSAINIDVKQQKHDRKIENYELNIATCTFCGICEENCPTQTLHHTQDYELAQDSREKLIYKKDGLLLNGPSSGADPGQKDDDKLIKVVTPDVIDEFEEVVNKETVSVKSERNGDS